MLYSVIAVLLVTGTIIFGLISAAKSFDYTNCKYKNSKYTKNELWLPSNKYSICKCHYDDNTNVFYTIKEYNNNKFLCQLGLHTYTWENQSTYMTFDRDLLRFNSTDDVNKFINDINNTL